MGEDMGRRLHPHLCGLVQWRLPPHTILRWSYPPAGSGCGEGVSGNRACAGFQELAIPPASRDHSRFSRVIPPWLFEESEETIATLHTCKKQKAKQLGGN